MADSLLDPQVLRELVLRLQATDVDELELTYGEARLYLRREPGARGATPSADGAAGRRTAPGIPIAAPLTGVFYSRPSPEQPVYVKPGDIVQAGEVVGLIETMKLFNEVVAEMAGEVVEVRAQDGDLVEAGQALMYVRPPSEGEEV
jgi:acetyl-CoA carboxylase biotin carboxyl carrier protein